MNIFDRLSTQRKIKLSLALGVLFTFGVVILAVTTLEQPIGQKYKPIYEYGGDFTLKSYQGDVALQDYRGKVVVVYFGFLNCTEACPISMGTIFNAIHKLTPAQRDKLQVFFISVDPKRDDLKSLHEFSQHFAEEFANEKNPNIIMGLTGTQPQIDSLSEQYGVFFDLVDMEGSALAYTVDHSSRFYMIGKDGKLVTSMNHSTTPIELAAKIKELQAL